MHPRILIISQNWDYTNPTRYLLNQELARKYGAILSGWNYAENPNDARFKNGGVDAVIADAWVFSDNLSHHYDGIKPDNVKDYNAPVFLNLLSYDLHNIGESFFKTVVGQADYVLNACTSKQFQVTDFDFALNHESWLSASSPMVQNPDFIDEKFVLIPHAIAASEFSDKALCERRYDASVLGASYAFRNRARTYLSSQQDISSLCRMDKLQSLFGRLSNHYILGPRLGFTALYRHRFRKLIAESKVSITCDGGIGYPIRKFFEIPANGAVLAASFFHGAQNLGFADRQNCFFLDRDNVQELREIVCAARDGSHEIEAIALAGKEMVTELHTVEKRAAQIVELITASLSGHRLTTWWQDGVLKITEHA